MAPNHVTADLLDEPFPSELRIGVLAPVLLVVLRLLQGLAVGGEVGGAVLLVAESLSKERRGFWTAWPQIAGPAGNLVAAAVFGVELAGDQGQGALEGGLNQRRERMALAVSV